MNRQYQSRIGLTIEEIYISSNRLQIAQLQTEHQVLRQLGEHSNLLTNIKNTQLELRDLLRLSREQIPHGSSSHKTDSYGPFIGIKMRFPHHKQFLCINHCVCNVHALRQFTLPHPVCQLVGALFVGYCGYPREAFRRCDNLNCNSRQTFNASIIYLFPSWFLKKAISVRLIANSYSEIQISLRVTRTIPQGAEIFLMVRKNDTSGLQQLFRQKSASPNDVDTSGETALYVRISFNIKWVRYHILLYLCYVYFAFRHCCLATDIYFSMLLRRTALTPVNFY